mgnify:CR=1 FL=1
MAIKKEKYDGRSRPTNQAYEESWNRIFGSNPVAKQVRTPKFKSQVVASKKIYNRRKLND